MSGVAVIISLIAGNSAVLAALGSGPPAATARIMTGELPLNTVLPAIAVTQVSSNPYNMIRTNETPKMHTERVQVTALFKGQDGVPSGTGYPGIKAMMRLILAACPSQRGTVNGVSVDSIVPDSEGPDLQDVPTSLYSCSRDFIVRYVL